jgi:hypothetical protein
LRKGCLLALVLAVGLILWGSCRKREYREFVSFVAPYPFDRDHELPAGDSTIMEPLIIGKWAVWYNEYGNSEHIPHKRSEERWSVDSPHVATVSPGGVIHAHSPGSTNATLRLRQFTEVRFIRVDPPFDSGVVRWAAREVMVGDTVDLYNRRYYADGGEENATIISSEPEEKDQNGIPVMWGLLRTAKDPHDDTVRFVARRIGRYHIKSILHGHEFADTISVAAIGGRAPRLFRSPEWGAPQQPVPGRRPHACYQLEFGEWIDDGKVQEAAGYSFLPSKVELDSTLIMSSRPDLGMRINAVGRERLQMPRSWSFSGDSVVLRLRARLWWRPNYRIRVAFPREGKLVTGRAEESSTFSAVRARRIPCG